METIKTELKKNSTYPFNKIVTLLLWKSNVTYLKYLANIF